MEQNSRLDIVLNEFLKIAEIPRPSHHEERISSYLYNWGKSRGLKAFQDEYKNVIIEKPASPGRENSPAVILQAHMDMVCVAEEGVEYDPVRDPIKVINDGRTLTASGTSLGADDGIGVAISLYILQDNSLSHGPLKVILTADEEDGMDSKNLDPSFLQGDYLINLDTEEFGSLCNSCAGGALYHFTSSTDWEDAADGALFTLEIKDLLGGHSGISIHLGHANAIVTLASFLAGLSLKQIPFRIVSFKGGQASNAIPKAASVSFITGPEYSSAVKDEAASFISSFKNAFRNIEGDYTFELSESVAEKAAVERSSAERVSALSAALSERLVKLMTVVPNNIHTMSPFTDGLVESSANLGIISINEKEFEFQLFARSSSVFYADQIQLICASLANQFEFDLSVDTHSPAWAVNPDSHLTELACEEFQKLTGKKMAVKPIHAGLECGVFALKNPNLDMIAIGPTLEGVHTPDESCCIEDVGAITELLVNILERL